VLFFCAVTDDAVYTATAANIIGPSACLRFICSRIGTF